MKPDQGRLFPADRPRSGRIRRGFDRTLRELRDQGRVSPADEAMTALCRVLADELDQAIRDDSESRFVRARVAATYQAALTTFLEAGRPGGDGDSELGDLLAALLHPDDTEPAE